MTSANRLNPRSFRQPFSALRPSLNTIVSIVVLLTQLRVFAVRNRTDFGRCQPPMSYCVSALESAYKIPPPKSTLDVLTDHLAQQGSLNIPGQ